MTTPPELEGFQRKYLRQLAHPSRPMVQVGEAGVTNAVRAAIDAALLDHELIKVRLRRPENKQKAAQDLAGGVGAALCGLVGHTVILYRPHPETPRIAVPERRDDRERAPQLRLHLGVLRAPQLRFDVYDVGGQAERWR